MGPPGPPSTTPGPPGPPGSGITPAVVTAQMSSNASTLYNEITLLTINITPSQSGSKLLITAGGGVSGGYDDSADESTDVNIKLYRGSTQLGVTHEGFYQPHGFYFAYLDTYNHGGSQQTYYLKMDDGEGYATEYVHARKGTSMCVQEII